MGKWLHHVVTKQEEKKLDKQILVFGGTSEGRQLAEIYIQNHIYCTICVATEYGGQILPKSEYLNIICSRLDLDEICNLLSGNLYSYVIDATHPYAAIISENARSACIKTGTPYFRLLRGTTDNNVLNNDNIITFPDTIQAAKYLDKTTGRILLTTGSKDLHIFCNGIKDTKRITARVLPSVQAIETCTNAGLEGRQVIAMHGPFSKELNIAIIKQTGAKFIVTKDSGAAGGFPEKISAAIETGITVILITRPVDEKGYTLNEILEITGTSSIDIPRQISLVGMGMGTPGTLTADGRKAIETAELIIGSGRLLNSINTTGKTIFNAYDADIIYNYIKEHPQYTHIAIILSGDTGFYSGADRLYSKLSGYNIKIIPGISSVSYFAARLKTNWQDTRLISLHGRTQNIIAAIKNNYRTFALLGTKDSIAELAKTCLDYGMDSLVFYVGCNFGYNNEKIIKGNPSYFTEYINQGFLYCIIIENPDACQNIITHGIPDSQFIRGNVPMTKEEIREISISKLHLNKDSIVYDIGAGTGSVSIECARMAYNGKVYSIEKKEEAIKLIEQNKTLHKTSNIEIINGTAPGILEDLEPPTHVFIGGTSGMMRPVINSVLSKNRHARIVINAITLETIAETERIIKETCPQATDIAYVSISKSKTLSGYNMMTGLNPVWIITLSY
jgi:precorrin-6Y C5,15-methyltransferase (decarboxylating)